jgi:hypothetical protein
MADDNDLTVGRTNVSGGGIWRSSSYDDDETSSSSEGGDNIVVVSGTTASTPAAAAEAKEYPSKYLSTTTTTTAIAIGELPQQPPSQPSSSFQWPTSADCYELGNRIGRGAFASVFAARIRRRTNATVVVEEEEEEEEGRQRRDHADARLGGKDEEDVECAVKIIDLEHVNINISGESGSFFSFVSEHVDDYRNRDGRTIVCVGCGWF